MKVSKDFINAILIAKLILENHGELITSKELDRQFLGAEEFVLTKTVQLHFTNFNYVKVIKQILREDANIENVSIKIYLIDTNDFDNGGSRIAGLVAKRKDDGYVILINKNESYCTQRLTLCKELTQIYTDCITESAVSADATKAIIDAARDLLTMFYKSSSKPHLLGEMTSESFAHAIALELMIPYSLRNEISAQISNGTDKAIIAERLRITQETLDEYLKTYFETATTIYQILS